MPRRFGLAPTVTVTEPPGTALPLQLMPVLPHAVDRCTTTPLGVAMQASASIASGLPLMPSKSFAAANIGL